MDASGERPAGTMSGLARHWRLDPGIDFLNHGAFGACPVPVLQAQGEWRDRMERDPVRFLATDLEPSLDAAREHLAAFVHADPDDLAFVPNATTGVSTILRALEPELDERHEILTTDHEYNAVLNALRLLARRTGARVVIARVPFPIRAPDEAAGAVLASVTDRTRLAVISHVTSATALVLPIARIVAALSDRGIDTLVDGAHAPGMVPLDIDALGVAYYTGNGHKWLCAPKGSGFLYVRRDRQSLISPLVTSHGPNSPRRDRSRFRLEFDWTGTTDPTPYLALPTAIGFMGRLLPGGWPQLMEANRGLALRGRELIGRALDAEALAPEEMVAATAAVPLSDALPPAPAPLPAVAGSADDETLPDDPLHAWLLDEHRIQVPVYRWPPTGGPSAGSSHRLIRISSQCYNDESQYGRLASVLGRLHASADPTA